MGLNLSHEEMSSQQLKTTEVDDGLAAEFLLLLHSWHVEFGVLGLKVQNFVVLYGCQHFFGAIRDMSKRSGSESLHALIWCGLVLWLGIVGMA